MTSSILLGDHQVGVAKLADGYGIGGKHCGGSVRDVVRLFTLDVSSAAVYAVVRRPGVTSNTSVVCHVAALPEVRGTAMHRSASARASCTSTWRRLVEMMPSSRRW